MPPNSTSTRSRSPNNRSSSTVREKTFTSTLRDRLCSEEFVPQFTTSSLEPYPKHNEIYRKLLASFSAISTAARSKPSREGDATHILMDNLAEAFARTGQEIYKSSTQSLSDIHDSVSAEIASFTQHASSALTSINTLYENIAYPLAATLCHSKSFPRATIGQHLEAMQTRLSTAEAKLAALQQEWTTCMAEARAAADEHDRGADNGAASIDEKAKMDGFKAEIDDIVRSKTREISQMEKRFLDEIEEESEKMKQSMIEG